ncbi:hypothetical protein CsatB_011912 [Cannabis sativa]|uniref:SET domain-containing protein n=1 Tax=Cannabis sativa TaxID=3483 RepID=A0A7J6GV52_CANSA|nr:protein-lysine N-methyltransferase EFM1 [Cannabis sativa]KAF4386785.1 hypothetical protein F8388_006740 [Cannabis sativa]KAF4397870.1 hypothetical protein G4B88_019591 [Cannabis sativa]
MANAEEEEAKLDCFRQWLQVNGVELRGCKIKDCDSNKGFGIFLANDVSDGVLLVVPLALAITPMRVLQDPLIGSECREMFAEGEVDDRFLMILFLTVERLRKNSSWKPYFDMLPISFGNPLWFSDDEISELKGTTLYRATVLQRKNLLSLYEDKVKSLVEKLLTLDGGSDREVCFEDFLWANSVFWARGLNIPLPRSYVFPQIQGTKDDSSSTEKSSEISPKIFSGELAKGVDEKGLQAHGLNSQVNEETASSTQGETLWVEGLVPGIDFCNHDLKPAATWEIDGTGSITGVPFSMYLLSAGQSSLQINKEITISYGNKGNEELLYLYGFIIENNPDDYLMVHYPVEAIQGVPFSDSKAQLLEAQNAEMRCLLPKSLLDHGFFPEGVQKGEDEKCKRDHVCSYSWSGQRKMPSYLDNLIFPDNFLSVLRTIAMQEDELYKVSTMLEELVGTEGERQPTDTEVRAAVWEACGDSGAFQLLVDLLNMRMTELEEHSGTEDSDTDLLKRADLTEAADSLLVVKDDKSGEEDDKSTERYLVSRHKWSCIVYRRGQKQLTRLFLREAEYALRLALSEGN